MKNKKLKITLSIIAILLILIVVIPLMIPVEGKIGLSEPEDLVDESGAIVTIPFKGTDGIDLYYDFESGQESETNFILLHGSMYNSKSWSEVMDYFGSIGNVYAYDQIPYGYSEKMVEGDWTGENPYTTEAALIQLEAFMEALEIEKAILVGSSFGGVLAADAAIRFQDRVEALILVDPAILVSESMPEWIVELPQVEHLGTIFAAGLSEGDGFYESTFYDKDKMTKERLDLSKRETHINNWNLAMWEYLKAWSTKPSDVGQHLDKISQPTLVISGEQDEIVPFNDSQKIAELIKDASFILIRDCGHMPHEEKPDEFIQIVDEWLKEMR